jgi:RNA polymerase sigma factor (sigma-70 family)
MMTSPLPRLLVEDVDAGFEQMVRAHADAVVTFARRICGSAGDDVAQETFIRALKSLRAMDTEQLTSLNPRPWLLTITRNTAYNHHRTVSRRPRVVGEVTVEPIDSATRSDVLVEQGEAMRALRDALDQLPNVQRDAVVLRHVLDLSTRDTAAVLQCSENTVKSHLLRGLRQLRHDMPNPEEVSS